ncbi:MAG: DUF5606 domain-containing protein [Chitinophagaceae bacterium]
MQYKEIVSVTGLGGLFHLLSTKSDGAIVRSLADNATKFIPSRLHNVTPLESIEIYTTNANVRLHEVLQQMKDSDKALPSAKADAAEIRAYFFEVYPDMDKDRVYTSDMKKMLKWYEILKAADLLDFSGMTVAEATQAEEAADAASPTAAAEVSEHKKAGDKKVPLVETGEEKPAKKASKKAAKTADASEEKPAKKTASKKKTEEAAAEATPEKKVAKPKKKAE